MVEIGTNGEVTVPEDIRGTYADPTIPLHERTERLAKNMESIPLLGDKIAVLLREAADVLKSNRGAAERRGKAQLVMQQQLHAARLEVTFLRNFLYKEFGKNPEFIQPSPYDTEERRKDAD
jgi:hypothetical protein